LNTLLQVDYFANLLYDWHLCPSLFLH
jgi:hypothetical protein